MNTTKQSTWRQRTITLQAGEVNEIVFPDTKPNHIHINNLGSGQVFLGMSTIPSRQIYDMIVVGFGENLYAQETGVSRVQIFLDSADNQLIKLTTFEHDFNPATIKPSNNGSVEGAGGGTTGEVTIIGHNAPLPSGANNIGRVVVSEMPQQNFTLDTLPAGTNNIGRVNVDILPPLAEGVSHIGSVGIDGGVTISSMPPVEVTNEPVKESHQYYEGTIGTTEIIFDMGTESVNRISYIVNEGTTDLYINLNGTVTTAITSGRDQSIRLLPNESIEDLPRKFSRLHMIRATGTGLVRFLGV